MNPKLKAGSAAAVTIAILFALAIVIGTYFDLRSQIWASSMIGVTFAGGCIAYRVCV